jgi:glycosyltransferase involved in cell wall biosynthesis
MTGDVMPEISVVIPTKDRLELLKQCIPMFLSYDEVKEIIVVADGCQDGTAEYLADVSESDSRIRYAVNVVNKGVSYSRNVGIQLAHCDYIFTAEDDLELSDDFFGILFKHMRDTGADVISARNIFRYGQETKDQAKARADRVTGPFIDQKLIMVHHEMDTRTDSVQPLLSSPVLVQSDVFRKIRFDDGYLVNSWREESDFQLAAHSAGYKLVFCPHVITYNLMIENDRGGVHAAVGLRRVMWVVRNNWRFVNKHREIIAREFGVTNRSAYIIRFAVWRAFSEIVLPALVIAKRRIIGSTAN